MFPQNYTFSWLRATTCRSFPSQDFQQWTCILLKEKDQHRVKYHLQLLWSGKSYGSWWISTCKRDFTFICCTSFRRILFLPSRWHCLKLARKNNSWHSWSIKQYCVFWNQGVGQEKIFSCFGQISKFNGEEWRLGVIKNK